MNNTNEKRHPQDRRTLILSGLINYNCFLVIPPWRIGLIRQDSSLIGPRCSSNQLAVTEAGFTVSGDQGLNCLESSSALH